MSVNTFILLFLSLPTLPLRAHHYNQWLALHFLGNPDLGETSPPLHAGTQAAPVAGSVHAAMPTGFPLDLWPHAPTELPALCGSSMTFHRQFALLFSAHLLFSLKPKCLPFPSHSVVFAFYTTEKIGISEGNLSFAKLTNLPASYPYTLPLLQRMTGPSYLRPSLRLYISIRRRLPPWNCYVCGSPISAVSFPSADKYSSLYKCHLKKIIFTWPHAHCPLHFCVPEYSEAPGKHCLYLVSSLPHFSFSVGPSGNHSTELP